MFKEINLLRYLFILLIISIPSLLMTTEWTIFVYMAADNNLHRQALNDIIELQNGLFLGNDNIQVILYIDHIPSYKNGVVEYIQVLPSSKDTFDSRIIRTLPDENSASPEALTNFLNWAYSRYASQKNILVLWSHGTGYTRNAYIERAGEENELTWILEDSSSWSTMSIYNGEFREVFRNHNKKYDIMVFDVCSSGSLEVISEIKDYADIVIASPSLFPQLGFPWSNIIPEIKRNISPAEVSEIFAVKFKEAYLPGGIYNIWGTSNFTVSVSVYDISKYGELYLALQNFSKQFIDSRDSNFYINIRNQLPEYNTPEIDIDLLYFVAILNDSIYVNKEIEDLYKTVNDFVIYKSTVNFPYEHSISIFYPNDFETFIYYFENVWSNLIFAESDWARFLNYAYGDDIYPPKPVSEINHVINLETIYIEWTAPIDPVSLRYRLDFFDENNINKEIFYSLTNNTLTKINYNGFFNIIAIDESNNHSEPRTQSFNFTKIESDRFYISPNPVRIQENAIKIVYYLTKNTSFVNITLYNIIGRAVWERKLSFHDLGEYSIEIENLSSGVYFGIFETENSRLIDKFSVIR